MIDNFQHILTSEDDLRSLLGHPSELVKKKTISLIDEHCRNFIAQSPLVLLASANRSGQCDVSPRGDAAGFILVLNERSLVIPERPGNKKLDTLLNIISNPHIGLIFLIPGLEETLRINGRACITKDSALLQQMKAQGQTPLLGIGVEAEECFIHCAKAFKRSSVWKPDTWPKRGDLPNAASMLAAHAAMEAREVEQLLHESYTRRLY